MSNTSSTPDPKGLQKNQVMLVLGRAIFLVSLPFGILDFVLPVYGKEIGASATQIGSFFTAFFLMLVLMRPLVGAGIDRFGRKPFFLAGILGYAITMFVFAFSTQVWALVLARVTQGIASSCMWLSVQAITADTSGSERRGQSFGKVGQTSSQGAILGTFIGFSLLLSDYRLTIPYIDFQITSDQHDWLLLFVIYGIISFFALQFTWRRLPETNPKPIVNNPRPIVWSQTWVLLLLVTLVTGAAWAMISPILMIYLQEKFTVDTSRLAMAFLPSALVWAFLPSRLGRLADRFGKKPLMVLGLLSAAASSLFIPYLSSLFGLTILWVLQALSYAAGDPAEQALVADLTGNEQRGKAYGLYAMAASLGAAAGPLLGGWMYEHVDPAAPFYANSAILLICALVLVVFLKLPRTKTAAIK